MLRRMASALNLRGVEVVPGAPKPLKGDAPKPTGWMIQRRGQLAAFNATAMLPEGAYAQHGCPSSSAPLPSLCAAYAEPSVENAAEAILRTARVSTRPATILALGPLSNVARAAEKDPD